MVWMYALGGARRFAGARTRASEPPCATSSFKLKLFDARQQRLVAHGQALGGPRLVEGAFAQGLTDLAALAPSLRPRAHFGEAAAQVKAIEQGQFFAW